jgi:hypothetical protein
MMAVTVFVVVSITDTVLPILLATKAWLPAELTATPVGLLKERMMVPTVA